MTLAIYLGDEVGAVGYRLAGVLTRVPDAAQESDAFDDACDAASLVLLSTKIAERIPTARLRAALRALAPIVVIVPDVSGEKPLGDVAARLRAELGLGT